MSKISYYPSADEPLQLSDRLIGTEAPRIPASPTPLATKNFSLGELLQLFSSNFPAATLQAVLDAGNIATQNITLTGTIDTTLIRPDNIEDTSGSQGLPFQFLSKGSVSINWVDLPVDNLQAVLNAGNTATQNINLVGNITSTRIIPGNIQDDTTGIGTTGQFLSKTASGIRWVNAPTSTTPGLGDVLFVNNTATNNINLTGEVYFYELGDNIGSIGGHSTFLYFNNLTLGSYKYTLDAFIFSISTQDDTAYTALSPSDISFYEGNKNAQFTVNGFFKADLVNLKSLSINFPTSIVGTNKTQTFQDASGTIALLSDIPSYNTPTLQEVLDEGNSAIDSAIFLSNNINDFETSINEFGDGKIALKSITNDTLTEIGAGLIYIGDLTFGDYLIIYKDKLVVNTIDYLLPTGPSSPLATLADIPSGGVTSVTATSPITSSGGATPDISTSMNTNKLIGRSTAGVGVMEEITVGTGLTLSGGTLNATATSVGFEQNFLLMGA